MCNLCVCFALRPCALQSLGQVAHDNGKVSQSELMHMLSGLGDRLSSADVQFLFGKLHADSDGFLVIDDITSFLMS